MVKIRPSLIVFLLATIMPSAAQQSHSTQSSYRPIVATSMDGEMSIDGTRMPVNSSIFLDSDVTSDDATHLKLINHGNVLMFTPKSNFRALMNAYKLNNGGSKVATHTGMIAYLPNCYSVMPVNPLFSTLYEVDWSGSSVWVYARSHDVRISYWSDGDAHHPWETTNPRGADRGWIVREGHVARIRDVKLCRPLIEWWPPDNLNTALELMGTAAVVTSEPWWWQQDISPEHP